VTHGMDWERGDANGALYCLNNGVIELAVSPMNGRIVHYGPVSAPNVLWTNPLAPQWPMLTGWVNWGGDKVWVWPEGDWKHWTGRKPCGPPGDSPTERYQVVESERHLHLVSREIPCFGLRIVRDISIEPSGTRVTLVNRLEKVAPGTQDLPVAPWMVTQVPAASTIYARLSADAEAPGYRSLGPYPWNDAEVADGIVILHRPVSPWFKMGLDADVLATPVGDWLFTSRLVSPDTPVGQYQPFRRAQVYSDQEVSRYRPQEAGPYVEMEFTAPVRVMNVGDATSLTVVWELVHATAGQAPAVLKRS